MEQRASPRRPVSPTSQALLLLPPRRPEDHRHHHVCSDNHHLRFVHRLLLAVLAPFYLPLLPHAHPESLKMAGETEVETPAAPQPDVAEEKKEIAEAENKTEEKKDEEKKEEEKPAKEAKKPKEKKPKKVPAPPPPPVHKKDFATDVVYVYQGRRPAGRERLRTFFAGS